ncbi:MAG: ABC transporter ATP-binding protein [Chloroflexi bacterium]|nr:ABC transporter ATP-binding protein [Chloroflexota bacterium]
MAPDPRPIEPSESGPHPEAAPDPDAPPTHLAAASDTATSDTAPTEAAASAAATESTSAGTSVPGFSDPVEPVAAADDRDPIRPAGSHRADPNSRGEIRLDDPNLVVAMRNVSRRFEDRLVLRDVDLAVPRGTILGIIGPSGAGKTTTIRMLTGALVPTAGEVSVLGRTPRMFRRSDRERIGYMPQSFALYEDLTAGENVDFVASLFGMLWRRRRRRVQEVLKVVGLWDARGRQAGRLSGGMQRRLELACALVHEPDLIILDEPTAGIDPLLRGTIWDELHRLRDIGKTLLVTTQHVGEADECDAVAMIVGGEIIALAPPDELRRMATHGDVLDIETAELFDSSTLVGLTSVGEITQDGPRHFRVVVDNAGSALPVVVEKITDSGVEVTSAREYRLSFDEIFAILVARHEPDRTATDAAASAEQREAAA